MADADAKGWSGALSDFLKNPPALMLVASILFAVLAVTTGIQIKGNSIAIRSYSFVLVALGIAAILFGTSVIFYFRENRSRRPGPYAAGRFPVRIQGPSEPIIVIRDNQTFSVTGIRKGRKWPKYKVMLMFTPTGSKRISPFFGHLEPKAEADNEFSWRADVKLPDLERVTKEEYWRLAFYYVGPNAQQIVDHHEAVCRYFAAEGPPKRWPPIENPSDEFVQCSDILKVSFRPA